MLSEFGFDKFFERHDYSMNFERIDDYFEYQGKYYLKILIALTNKNNSFDSYAQMRYLNSDTGEFLPFTHEITRITPNQYAYNQETINL